jgi:amino acid permease
MTGKALQSIFYTNKGFYAFLMSLPILPFIFKKEIHELKLTSILLFMSISLFMLVFILELALKGSIYNPDTDYSIYYMVHLNADFLTAVSVFITAF